MENVFHFSGTFCHVIFYFFHLFILLFFLRPLDGVRIKMPALQRAKEAGEPTHDDYD